MGFRLGSLLFEDGAVRDLDGAAFEDKDEDEVSGQVWD